MKFDKNWNKNCKVRCECKDCHQYTFKDTCEWLYNRLENIEKRLESLFNIQEAMYKAIFQMKGGAR